MKLIFLNTWGGQLFEPLKKFVSLHAKDTDIFCFQEVYKNALPTQINEPAGRLELCAELQELLPGFSEHFVEVVPHYGHAIFLKKPLTAEKEDSEFILPAEEISHLKNSSGKNYYPKVIQTLIIKDKILTIFSYHGLPGTGHKDTPEREIQTQRLLKYIDRFSGKKILVGDLNLNIDTQAIGALEQKMINLIKDSGFSTTRNHYYEKRLERPFGDYIFVSPDIRVKNFAVLQDEVSDHLPLLLEFS